MTPFVDLRSDTVTRPTAAMRRAIADAIVGDDVLGDDPTVQRLEAMVAERLGKEAALFTPSGTMANQLAIRCHTRPGDEILVEAGAHPFNYEAAGAAMISGVQIRTQAGERGMLDPEAVATAFHPDDPHYAPLKLVCVEDTANRGGGTVWPLERLDAVSAAARAGGAATHLDGARFFNAVVASGIPAARRAQGYDTVSVCLSKGLGAPVGSLLAGDRALIHVARRMRKALGGGMRQAGILAAAGVHAIEQHIDRLADDHARALQLVEGLRSFGYSAATPDTNMVYVTVPDGGHWVSSLAERGIRTLAVGPDELRLVTHLDVDDSGIAKTLDAFEALAP
ncbi:MAG: GntG family PLP-dependent aldolase [Myxococcota bacterium]|nr:GntG family PLP-dependent aldolase [Myxococcota bacterium]